MKISITICVALLISFWANTFCQAQHFRIGAKGGLSFPSLSSNSSNELTDGYKSRFDANYGLFADIGISKTFSIKTGIEFAGQGGKRNGMQPIPKLPPQLAQMLPPGTTLYANFNNETVLHYLEIPLLAKLEWGGKWKYYLDAGPYAGFLLSAETKTSGTSLLYFDSKGTVPLTIQGQPAPAVSFEGTTDVQDELKSVNAGITGGGGIVCTIGKQSELVLDVRGSYGLTTLQKDEANGKTRTGGVFVTLGYAWQLGKK